MTSIFDMFQLVAANIWLYGGTFVLVLSLLVFVHEWGHYIVARLCGVKVETFSIGFGKELFGWTDKKNTRWKVSLIPLGGYVKMFGDTDPASSNHSKTVNDGVTVRPMTIAERNVAFFAKPVWKRSLIVFAGPGINFLFAILLLSGLYYFHGQPITEPVAAGIIKNGAADKAGFLPHDKILSINGENIQRFEDVRRIVTVALDTPLNFSVLRNEKEITITATPEKQELTDRFGFTHSRGMLGIIGPGDGIAITNIKKINGKPVKDIAAGKRTLLANMDKKITVHLGSDKDQDAVYIHPSSDINKALKVENEANSKVLILGDSLEKTSLDLGLFASVKASVVETWGISISTLKALGQMFTGTRSPTELGGIIRIGAIAGDMAQAGLIALITFTALLSINLGLINLFPIPMLDGGHLVFYAIESLKGSPVSEKYQEYAFRFGFAVLIGLMLFANLNDLFQVFIKN